MLWLHELRVFDFARAEQENSVEGSILEMQVYGFKAEVVKEA